MPNTNSNSKSRQEGQEERVAESNAAACSIGNLLAFNLFITPVFVHFHCCDKSINLHFFGMRWQKN